MLFAIVVTCLIAWYVFVKWVWAARAEEWTRRSERNQPAQDDPSGARGVYLVHNPKMLRAHGVVVFELGYGRCAVHFGQPGTLLDAGTPQARELLKAPSGAELIAVPTDSDPDAPWRLDLHVPPSSPWRRSSDVETDAQGALPSGPAHRTTARVEWPPSTFRISSSSR